MGQYNTITRINNTEIMASEMFRKCSGLINKFRRKNNENAKNAYSLLG
jgi:hypothetical protein